MMKPTPVPVSLSASSSRTARTTRGSLTCHPGVHPLAQAMTIVKWLDDQHETLVKRSTGPLGHNTASDTAFELLDDVSDRRVLVVDDTWTTDATAQSAAIG